MVGSPLPISRWHEQRTAADYSPRFLPFHGQSVSWEVETGRKLNAKLRLPRLFIPAASIATQQPFSPRIAANRTSCCMETISFGSGRRRPFYVRDHDREMSFNEVPSEA